MVPFFRLECDTHAYQNFGESSPWSCILRGTSEPFHPAHGQNPQNTYISTKLEFFAEFHQFLSMFKPPIKQLIREKNNTISMHFKRAFERFAIRH